MSELEEKLNALLSDPNSMAQVMQMAQQLSGAMGEQKAAAPPPPPPVPPVPDLGAALGGLDPKLLGKLLPLAGELGTENSAAMQLLNALRPFLKEEKQGKIQRAARLARLIHVGKKLLADWEGEPCITAISAMITAYTPGCPSRRRLRRPVQHPHPDRMPRLNRGRRGQNSVRLSRRRRRSGSF